MVDYSPLGDCIFKVVFVIVLGNSPVPDVSPPLLRILDSNQFVSRGFTKNLTHSRVRRVYKKCSTKKKKQKKLTVNNRAWKVTTWNETKTRVRVSRFRARVIRIGGDGGDGRRDGGRFENET